MGSRLQLQTLLEDLLGSRNVYFQPPESVKLAYPCIVYKRGNIGKTTFADDKPYHHRVIYQLILIDQDPDSNILDKIAILPMCSFERHYTADNLNHDVYNIYY
jgi:hypothetical protein